MINEFMTEFATRMWNIPRSVGRFCDVYACRDTVARAVWMTRA